MEIAPIAGIRVVPALKQRPADPELTVFFDIESTARPDDDTFTRNGRKAAGAEEDDEEQAEGAEESAAPEESVGAGETDAPQISFFA